jgi:hypothetical protein
MRAAAMFWEEVLPPEGLRYQLLPHLSRPPSGTVWGCIVSWYRSAKFFLWAVPSPLLPLNPLILIKTEQVPSHVLPTSIAAHALHAQVGLALEPCDCVADSGIYITLAMQNCHHCKASALVDHGAEVALVWQVA